MIEIVTGDIHPLGSFDTRNLRVGTKLSIDVNIEKLTGKEKREKVHTSYEVKIIKPLSKPRR